MEPLEIKSQNPKSSWVALDIKDGITVLGEGMSPNEAMTDAESKGHADYMLCFNCPNPPYFFGMQVSENVISIDTETEVLRPQIIGKDLINCLIQL